MLSSPPIPDANVPAEILEWLGLEYYNEKNYAAAEKYLSVLGKIDNPGERETGFLVLSRRRGSRSRKISRRPRSVCENICRSRPIRPAKPKCCSRSARPRSRAHKPDDAQKIAEEIMRLQPEGRVNAEARLLAGDVQVERGNFDEAGKAFMGVALLYDDPAITPRALQKAALGLSTSRQRPTKPTKRSRNCTRSIRTTPRVGNLE